MYQCFCAVATVETVGLSLLRNCFVWVLAFVFVYLESLDHNIVTISTCISTDEMEDIF